MPKGGCLPTFSLLTQGRHLSIHLHLLLDAVLHLTEATGEAGSQAPAGHGGSDIDGADRWWGTLTGSTREGSLLELMQSLQTMWDVGGHSASDIEEDGTGPDIEVERTLPAKARTSPGLPSRMDVPTRDQASSRVSAAAVLGAIRQLVALVWPTDHPASVAAAGSGSREGRAAAYADWEVLQAEVLMPLPPPSERAWQSSASSSAAASAAPSDEVGATSSEGVQRPAASFSSSTCCWGEGLWCFNHACANLSGPSELAMQTSACGGGCGVRYCSTECQAQGWRDGHRLSCARLKARREVAALGGGLDAGPS